MKQPVTKTFVVDSSVFAMNAEILYELMRVEIVIPAAVIREMDGLKSRDDHAGANAREMARILDRLGSYQNLAVGVRNSAGNLIRIEHEHYPVTALSSNADNHVVGTALMLQKLSPRKVILLSNDTNMRVVARSLGLRADSYPLGFDEIEPTEVVELPPVEFRPLVAPNTIVRSRIDREVKVTFDTPTVTKEKGMLRRLLDGLRVCVKGSPDGKKPENGEE